MRYLFIFALLFGSNLQAQQRFYFVSFKDKPNFKTQLYQPATYISAKAIERRTRNRVPLNENDIPPDSAYLRQLAAFQLTMYGNSRWFNGTVVLSAQKYIEDSIKLLPFVSAVTYLGPAFFYEEMDDASENSLENQLNILEQSFQNKNEKNDTIMAGKSFAQIKQLNDEGLVKAGIGGKNVLIAVIDAGFKNADQLVPFRKLMKEKQILSSYDFVEKEEEVFDDDPHGTAVLSCMAAVQQGLILGTAPNAQYILLRSENAANEYLVEEYFWALAAEYADSAGADIINSSLGYTKHDEKSMGHKFSELDGKTTLITRAAEIAASKGILVVVSAGNEGDDPWRQISAPADAAHVLTVGAVDKFNSYAGFSSVGPTADKRNKPDLTALGKGVALLAADGKVFEGNGTSYSCPLIAGAAAQLLEMAPKSSAERMKEALILSGSQYYKVDKYTGAGIPDIELAAKMLCVQQDSLLDVRELQDQNLHLCLNARAPQKVILTIEEPIKGEIDRITLTLKKGSNRFVIKGYKKRPNGLYHLSVEFLSRKTYLDFMKL